MRLKSSRRRTAIVLVLPGLVGLAPISASAQIQLPGVVVQGGTLAPPPVQRAAPPEPVQAAPAPQAQAPTPPRPQPVAPAAVDTATPAGGGGGNAGANGTASNAGSGTGSGTPGAGPAADGYASDSVGSSVSVVTGDDIRRQQIRYAADALRSLPGVSVGRTGSFGGLTSVRIRGAESNHTLVIIDGVVANDTNNGLFDFSDLSAENIERIEVIRGPQSGLYGSNALGGVVNIVTKGGKGPMELTLRTEGGSFGTFDYAARLSGGNDQAWGSVAYNERHSTGFNIAPVGTEKDGATLKTLMTKGGVRIVDGLVLDFTLRYSDKRGDRDTEGGAPGTLAVQVDDPAKFANTVFLGGLNLRWDTLDGALTHVLRGTRNAQQNTDFATFGGFPSVSRNDSEAVKYGYLGTWRFDTPALVQSSHALTVLLEHENEKFTPLSDFADGLTRSRERVATALEYKGEVLKRLNFTGNIRYDDNSTFASFTTWRLAASLKVPELGLRPHSSIGTAVKLPTMYEQFGFIPGFFTPNPNLVPEESKGWDAGLEFSAFSRRAVLDVTYFKQNLLNKITTTFVGGASTAINLPGISHRDGIEVSTRFALTQTLLLSGAYTHLTATDSKGLTEIRRPSDSGRVDLAYLFAGGRGIASVSALYNGVMSDTAFRLPFFVNERVALHDYWLLNIAGSYKIQPGVELFARVENLLNEKYQEIYGYNTPGVGAFGGLKLTFGGEGDPAFKPRER